MTPQQRRRLEALTAAAAPCLGCHQEDLIEAEGILDSLAPERVIKRQASFDRAYAKAGRVPPPRASEAELERERVAFQAIADGAAAAIQKVTKTVPPRSRRTTCPHCEPRKRTRQQIEVLAARISSRVQDRVSIGRRVARAQRLRDATLPRPSK
jgi:hypothetical protein